MGINVLLREGMFVYITMEKEWECLYIILWERDGNGNTVKGMGGKWVEKVILAHL